MEWKDIPKDEYLAIWHEDRWGVVLDDNISTVQGRYVAGSKPLGWGRAGTKAVYFPVCVDINGRTLDTFGCNESSHVYGIRYATLCNLVMPRLKDCSYYIFDGFHVSNSSKVCPNLNRKDMLYRYKKMDSDEIVLVSPRIAYNGEYPTFVEFFGRGVVEYMLNLYGGGQLLSDQTYLGKF